MHFSVLGSVNLCILGQEFKIKPEFIAKMDIFGFFLQNLSKDENFKLSLYLKRFKKCKTNLQRMNFVYNDMKRCQTFPPFKEDKKDDAVAIMLREIGNGFYKAGNYREAMDYYTMSIMNAQSEDLLALAFGNRSAAFLKLNLHKECLTDIDRAFKNGYPDNLKPKLIARRNCSQKTHKPVKNAFYEPLPTFPESEKNGHIQSARNCIRIMKNEQYGRHVVATRNIEIGEILAVETPYTAILNSEVYVHCHECFQLCYNMIPCDKCTKALYCSTTCKNKAFNSYHKYECPILLSLDFMLVDFPKRLALKTVFLSKNEWDRNTDTNTSAEEDDQIYRSDRFKEICSLEGHTNSRCTENLLARTVIACGLFHLIKNKTKFPGDCVNEDHFKEILLLLMLVCGINTVNINELSPNLFGIYDTSPIATAVYSFFTLFNHSCWPNVSRHFHGSTMVLRANHTIKKGQQCFVCYGPNFVSYTKEFRQNFLKEQQFFTCTCRACQENWSLRNYTSFLNEWSMLDWFLRMRFEDADVNVAKEELQRLLVEAKKAERSLPPGRDYVVKDLLEFCYNIFGNKRRV